MLTLIEGPAGAGKSQVARRMLNADPDLILADTTALWAALRGVERGPDGRFPVRTDADPTIRTGLASWTKAAVVRQSLREGLDVIVTAGVRGQAERWREVAEELGDEFAVATVDPGRAVAAGRLGGAAECAAALARWYG